MFDICPPVCSSKVVQLVEFVMVAGYFKLCTRDVKTERDNFEVHASNFFIHECSSCNDGFAVIDECSVSRSM